MRYRYAPDICGVGDDDEKNFPAKQPTAPQEARLPGADADPTRPQDSQRSAPSRSQADRGLTDQGFPKAVRLRRRAEFQRVYRDGVRSAGRHVVVFAAASEGCGEDAARLGVTASKKIGNAVVRARSKRRIRELFRARRGELAGVAVDLVVNARRGCAGAPWVELSEDFQRCLSEVRARLASHSRRSPSTSGGSHPSSPQPVGSDRPVRSTRPRPSPATGS